MTRSTGRRRAALARAAAVLCVVALVVVVVPTQAQALFSRSTTAAVSVGTATVVAPTSVAASVTRCTLLTRNVTVQLSWPDVAGESGYEIVPYVNNVAQTPITVAQNVTSYSYSRDGALLTTRSYRFTVQTQAGTWESATTSSSSVSC